MFRFAASSTPSTLTQTVIRLGAVAAACSALTWSLSGCGGGSRAKEYVPDSVVSFGDENSAIETYSSASNNLKDSAGANISLKGLVYTVNSVPKDSPLYCAVPSGAPAACVADSTAYTDVGADFSASVSTVAYVFSGTKPNTLTLIEIGTATRGSTPGTAMQRSTVIGYNCAASTLWNQVVAHNFGKGFADSCAIDNDGAKTYAAHGAMVADLQAQVAAHRGELRDGVLVTVMIGQNDILDIYGQVRANTMSDSTAQQELANRGAVAAAIVKDILSTGAKVVLSLTPDLGQSPKASLSNENASLLSQYTTKFNDALKFGMGNVAAQDGRHFALVESDLFTNPITRSVSYVYNTAVCAQTGSTIKVKRPDGGTVAANTSSPFVDDGQVKYCTGSSLIDGGNVSTYIWADNIHFAPAGHNLIGTLAASRVANQF